MLYLHILVLTCCLSLTISQSDNLSEDTIIFDLVSESVHIKEKSVLSNIEIFKPVSNEPILKEKNASQYEKLKFYSFGKPTLVASDQNNIFHFTSKGFYIQVEVLTKLQRNLIQEELETKYSVDLNENQIKSLAPTKFECRLEIECDEFLYLDGITLNTNEYPLRVHFNASKNSKEMKCIQTIIKEDEDDFSFDCHLAYHMTYLNKETSLIGRSYILNKSNFKSITSDDKLTEKIELLNERVTKLEKAVEKLVESSKVSLSSSNSNENANGTSSAEGEPDAVDLETEDNSPYDGKSL